MSSSFNPQSFISPFNFIRLQSNKEQATWRNLSDLNEFKTTTHRAKRKDEKIISSPQQGITEFCFFFAADAQGSSHQRGGDWFVSLPVYLDTNSPTPSLSL